VTHAPHGPLSRYRARLADGALRPDSAQEHIIRRLDALAQALPAHDRLRARPGRVTGGGLSGLARRLTGRRTGTADPSGDSDGGNGRTPRGLYIHGAVGRGKSMLMDLFHDAVAIDRKRRVHFQVLMREVHETLHRWRREGNEGREPLARLAEMLAADLTLLCLDEMEIRDIADAMIVAGLFERLMAAGVVVVTTSNRPPADLYKDGLQREKFLPFIALLEERLDRLELDAAQDYRTGRLQGRPVYYHPLGANSARALEALFRDLLDGMDPAPDVVPIHGREVPVPRAGNGVAWFGFDDLCGRPLGSADYQEIASLYDVVMVPDIPRLTPADRDRARRFVLLIDALYEHTTALICGADAPPQDLYVEGEGRFEFDRTVSRLIEMQAADYLGRPHRLDGE
jgi:cell division protein ZapE